ncbi:MAG: hypothetical protein SPK09_06750 [Porphyromonas sp.]|nr:hypothetical protein [Porphyromonas sp.]
MAEEILGYDDLEAVAFIRNYIPQDLKERVSDDDIIYFVDLIYDFYESRGILGEDLDDEEGEFEFDDEELLDYVVKNAKKDEVGQFSKDEIRFIVQGEMAYSESLGLFED